MMNHTGPNNNVNFHITIRNVAPSAKRKKSKQVQLQLKTTTNQQLRQSQARAKKVSVLSNSQIAKQIKEKRSMGGFEDESYQEEKVSEREARASQRKKSVPPQKEPTHARTYSSNAKSI